MSEAIIDWIELLDREYLADFILSGGSSVKIGITSSESRNRFCSAVMEAGQTRNYLVVEVKSEDTRVDKIQDIYFALAKCVNWVEVINSYMRNLLVEQGGVNIPENIPLSDIDGIAYHNYLTAKEVRSRAINLAENQIAKDYSLAKDFRIAMSGIAAGIINPMMISQFDQETIVRWLRGEKCDMKTLKRLQIFQKIGRHNARWMICSLARWIKKLNFSGFIILLDIHGLFKEKDESGNIHYARSRVLDFYETLRQFIDDTDEMEHLIIIVNAPIQFAADPKRSYFIYDALKFRIVDEVHDVNRPNPLNVSYNLIDEE